MAITLVPPTTQTPPSTPNSLTTGITGEPGGAGYWYSPLFFKVPAFTEDARKIFDTIKSLLQPLIQVQQLKIDAFQPVVDLIQREADVFANIVGSIKNFVQQALSGVIDIFKNTGYYVIIVLPDVVVKRYIWVPKRIVVDPKTMKPISVQAGGFFAITDQQYAQYGKAKSAMANLPLVGSPVSSDIVSAKNDRTKQLITVLDENGHPTTIDLASGTGFPSVGSTGMQGFVNKFNNSFFPVGQSTLGVTKQGNRTDLCIPSFKQGDVVTGLSFMISAPGFTHFTDAIFAFINLFLPGSTLEKQFTKTRLSSVSMDDAILKSLKLRVKCTGLNINYQVGKQYDPKKDMRDQLDSIDPKTCMISVAVTDIDLINALPAWKIEFYIRATNLSAKNGDPTFDYNGAQVITPADGYMLLAEFYADTLQGKFFPDPFTVAKVKFETKLYDNVDTNLVKDNVGPKRVIPFENLKNGLGFTYLVPKKYFDYKFEFRTVLKSLYNQRITPELLVGNVLSSLNKRYANAVAAQSLVSKWSDVIKKGTVTNPQAPSMIDTLLGQSIESFTALTSTKLNQTQFELISQTSLLYILDTTTQSNGDHYIDNHYLIDVQTLAFQEVKYYFFNDLNITIDIAIKDSNFNAFVTEVYQYAKYGPRNDFKFYVDNNTKIGNGADIRQIIQDHLSFFDSGFNAIIKSETTFEKIDQYETVIYASKAITPGSIVPALVTNPTRAQYSQLSIGIPAFRFDRWFCVNVESVWPSLFVFLENFKTILSKLNNTFPALQSPLLNFLNSILNELNSIIAIINDVITTLDNLIGVLEILAAELFHVLRIEDTIGKGYTTGGNEAIKNIILRSPGLPEYLKENIVRAANITIGGVSNQASLDLQADLTAQQRAQNPTVFNPIVTTPGSPSIPGVVSGTAPSIVGLNPSIPVTESVQASNSSDAFVANVTILAGIPQIEDPTALFNELVTTAQQVSQFAPLQAQMFQLTQQSEALAIQLSQLEIRQTALQAILANAKNYDPGTVANAQTELNNVNTQFQTVSQQKIALEAQINAIQTQELAITKPLNSPTPTKDQLVQEKELASVVTPFFDFIEQTILGVTPAQKQAQIDKFNSVVTITPAG